MKFSPNLFNETASKNIFLDLIPAYEWYTSLLAIYFNVPNEILFALTLWKQITSAQKNNR